MNVAEVLGSSFVLERTGGTLGVDFHSAYRVNERRSSFRFVNRVLKLMIHCVETLGLHLDCRKFVCWRRIGRLMCGDSFALP